MGGYKQGYMVESGEWHTFCETYVLNNKKKKIQNINET